MLNTINYTSILSEVSDMPFDEIRSYLIKKYSLSESAINNVLNIINHDKKHSQLDISKITSDGAKSTLDNFIPSKFVGRLFGGYKAISIISSTNKSVIYRGVPEPRAFDLYVAIKIITPTHQYIAGDDHLAMQAQYMANIEHINIVDIKDFGITNDGIHFVIMEYLPGHNIAEFCKSNELPVKDRLKLFLQVLSGVAKMHVIPLIHGDLKPQNVIMNVNNIPKIIDFDLSKSLSTTLHNGYNYKNINGFTTRYAAPEQKGESGNVTIVTDIYGLGQILFESLTGQPFANCSESIDVIMENHSKGFSRWRELAYVLQKALNDDPNSRHQNTTELIHDITNIIKGDKISPSYQPNASFLYRAGHFYRRSHIAIWVVMLFVLLSTLSVNSIINERNEAWESLRLVMETNNPQILDNNDKLEVFAQKALDKAIYSDDIHFQELIGWGDVFLGRGLNDKAKLYFHKALSIYPNNMSNEHIIATTKLVKANSRLINLDEINRLIGPYLNILKSQQINNPYLIQLYLETYDIVSILNSNVFDEDDSFKLSDSLNRLDISNIPDPQLQRELKLHILLRKGISEYYSLPSDYVSVLSYVNKKKDIQLVEKTLKSAKLYLDNAINLIVKFNINTHLEPKILAWLAHVESELKNYSLAESYLDQALTKSIEIFGDNHYRTIQIYIKGYASFRYHDMEKALRYAKKANKSFNEMENKNFDYYSLTYDLLASAYRNIGDIKNLISTINQFSDYYKANSLGGPFFTQVYSAALFELGYLVYFDEPKIEKYYFEAAMLEPIYRKMFPSDNTYRWDKYLMSIKNKQFEIAKKLHIEYLEYIISENSDFDYDTRTTELLSLASNCLNYGFCNAIDMVPHIESTMSWSKTDDQISVEKLSVLSQLAYIYVINDDLNKAKEYLSEIKPILKRQTFSNSIHFSYFYKIQAMIAFKEGDNKAGNRYKKLALAGAEYNFGKDSRFVKSIKDLE